MVFIDTMKTIFLKNHQQHQSILGANSIKEFPRRRASLKTSSDERIESLEDAASHKKREKLQVCAGVCRVLTLSFILIFILIFFFALFIYTQSITGITTFNGRHFIIFVI